MKKSYDFSKISEYIKDGAYKAKKKSVDIIEVSKLNIEISSLNKSIKVLYEEIGEGLYKKYLIGKEIDDDFKDYCKELQSLNKKMESLRKKILKSKDMRPCKFCGATIAKASSFCPSCGKKL